MDRLVEQPAPARRAGTRPTRRVRDQPLRYPARTAHPRSPTHGSLHWSRSDTPSPEATFYQYAHDRGRRTIKGIEAQVAKAEAAVAGKASVKRNRFVQLAGGTRSVNRALEEKAKALAGWKAYVTNLPDPDAEMVIGSYRRLFQIERSFRMAKSDLAARPIYHRKQDSIEAHLTIVFAAMAVAHWVEQTTGWSIKRFVKTARRYRTVTIAAGDQVFTAADPVPDELDAVLKKIRAKSAAH